MGNDVMLGSLYLLLALVMIVGSLISRREPIAKLIVMALAWIAIFAGGFVLFTFRDDLGFVAARLRSEATGEPVVTAKETRVPMAVDGHFWVDALVNGHKTKFLVDSGATMTTINRATAQAANVDVSGERDQIVRTGNGAIRVASGRVSTLSIGGIERHDLRVQVADGDNLSVLGMNFLSSLKRWGVEGRWLILVS